MKLTKAFVLRLSEQVGVAALGAFASVLATADSVSVDKALLIGAVTAAVRAAYGVVVRTFGDPDQPNAVK